MYTVVPKEAIDYYASNGSSVFCTQVDAIELITASFFHSLTKRGHCQLTTDENIQH